MKCARIVNERPCGNEADGEMIVTGIAVCRIPLCAEHAFPMKREYEPGKEYKDVTAEWQPFKKGGQRHASEH